MLHLKAIRRVRGFSLVELLVVMGIMASLALVAIPWFVKISQRNSLKSAAREVQTTLLAARIKAVNRNGPVSVVISSLGPPVVFQTFEPNPPLPTPTHFPTELSLPGRSARLQETPTSAGGMIIFGGDGRLANPPAQPTPGLRYVLEGPIGVATPNRIQVYADSSGHVTVVTPVNWY